MLGPRITLDLWSLAGWRGRRGSSGPRTAVAPTPTQRGSHADGGARHSSRSFLVFRTWRLVTGERTDDGPRSVYGGSWQQTGGHWAAVRPFPPSPGTARPKEVGCRGPAGGGPPGKVAGRGTAREIPSRGEPRQRAGGNGHHQAGDRQGCQQERRQAAAGMGRPGRPRRGLRIEGFPAATRTHRFHT